MPSAAAGAGGAMSQLVEDDDDFQDLYAPTQLAKSTQRVSSTSSRPLQPSNNSTRPPKKKLKSSSAAAGKENTEARSGGKPLKRTATLLSDLSKLSNSSTFTCGESFDLMRVMNAGDWSGCHSPCKSLEKTPSIFSGAIDGCDLNDLDSLENCSLDAIKPSIECTDVIEEQHLSSVFSEVNEKKDLGSGITPGYLLNSIESKLISGKLASDDDLCQEFEVGEELDMLIKLCTDGEPEDSAHEIEGLVCCPLCGLDISHLSEQSRQVHTNDCLDEKEDQFEEVLLPDSDNGPAVAPHCTDGYHVQSPGQVVDVSPVLGWLRSLGLERYEEAFVREEVDWDSLQWLTEEDLFNMGITALGPRKKIVHALNEVRKTDARDAADCMDEHGKKKILALERENNASKAVAADISTSATNRRITDYFPGSCREKKPQNSSTVQQKVIQKLDANRKAATVKQKNQVTRKNLREIPKWCCIPGTPFRVDAFRFLRRDCSHWFLTHFHMDHYQGLTRSFCHGKIYCSQITAKLVHMKIGIPWDRLQVLPLNQKINIDGVNVTCLDANHCPGSIIILFEPPNAEAVLHTGDFRFCEEMQINSILQTCHIHTLILDTTYCQPQYDFPKQEAVIQFVIEAIQAEAFNPKTLFLIGSYTIGKERLYLEVGRALQKKIYVGAAKLRILECFEYCEEDMRWLTINEQESHIHVVPMWMLASFKRLKQISNQYQGRFSLIVALSPTGWTFGKGKKGTGRRWQQGTIIRYEVPYSEHSSFSELREFVKFVSPVNIIPSVNNDGPDSEKTMISLLSS